MLSSEEEGGVLLTFNSAGNGQVLLGAEEAGGVLHVLNKIGERVAGISIDDDGNGYVGAFNRKGKGRTLRPGN
jgi:hypothetical protein